MIVQSLEISARAPLAIKEFGDISLALAAHEHSQFTTLADDEDGMRFRKLPRILRERETCRSAVTELLA